MYLNEGNDSEGYDPYADQADPVAPSADPETEVCEHANGFTHVVPKGGSHGIDLLETGDASHAPTDGDIEAKIAMAAVNETDAVIQEDGKISYLPMENIDPEKVELACDGNGFALIPDDGDSTNDIIVDHSDLNNSG